MLTNFRNLPISRKITQAILWTNLIGLILSGGAIATYELVVTRARVLENLNITAHLIAVNSTGAMAFGDTAAAQRILLILEDQSTLMAARLYTAQGKPFATYHRRDVSEGAIPAIPLLDQTLITNNTIKVFQTIKFKNDRIGTIYLESDMSRVYERIRSYLLIITTIIALLMPLILFIAGLLQKIIAEPIYSLDEIAHQIATYKKYSIRAQVKGTDEIGRLTETFNHMLDSIEERNRLLEQQAEELGRSNKELEQFAYVSSHDLQEPLRKITAYSQLIEAKHKGQFDQETAKYIDNICTSAERMRTLISSLLAYSRVSRQDIQMHKIELSKVLQEVLNDMESSIKEKKANVYFVNLPSVRGNAIQLRQLFQNLIGNAIKFHGDKDPEVNITCRNTGDHWVIGVEDNGIGIDQQYADKVFQVFQRLHGRGEFPGTGIGLAICKKIVEQNGGKIWVESEKGKGSTFYFTWPMSSSIN